MNPKTNFPGGLLSDRRDFIRRAGLGGLSLALARAFKIIDPKLVHPSREHWERAFELFSLLM